MFDIYVHNSAGLGGQWGVGGSPVCASFLQACMLAKKNPQQNKGRDGGVGVGGRGVAKVIVDEGWTPGCACKKSKH